MNQTTRLIINADDLGAGAPTDRGIIEAFTKGIVGSASILANGTSFNSAAKMAVETKLPIGVHLNLAEGFSLTGTIPGLTDSDGQFYGKQISRQLFLSDSIDPAAIQNEFIAQIDKVKSSGLQPDHLDTHQHCGLFPIVTAALIAAAKKSDITRIRLSKPVHPAGEDPPPPLGDEMRLYRQLAPRMTEQFCATGLVTPDGLLGMPLLNRLDEMQLLKLLSNLRPGTWELMVHPGYFDPRRAFAGTERVLELTALTSINIRSLIKQHQIKLINFSEL